MQKIEFVCQYLADFKDAVQRATLKDYVQLFKELFTTKRICHQEVSANPVVLTFLVVNSKLLCRLPSKVAGKTLSSLPLIFKTYNPPINSIFLSETKEANTVTIRRYSPRPLGRND